MPCVTIIIWFIWYFHGVIYTWYTGTWLILSECVLAPHIGHRKCHWTSSAMSTKNNNLLTIYWPVTDCRMPPTCAGMRGARSTLLAALTDLDFPAACEDGQLVLSLFQKIKSKTNLQFIQINQPTHGQNVLVTVLCNSCSWLCKMCVNSIFLHPECGVTEETHLVTHSLVHTVQFLIWHGLIV